MPFSYENYDDVCTTYTAMRRPVGNEEQLAFFRANPSKPELSAQAMLDAGCGTGNYAVAYAPHFGSIRCVDYSAGMLRTAEANVRRASPERATAQVTFARADICDLTDEAAASFDALCCNQVVHHLRADDDHADLRRAARAFFRVLRPGGRAAVNFTAPESQLFATWWSALIPDAVRAWERRAPTLACLEAALRDASFSDVRAEIISDVMYDQQLYYDLDDFVDDVHRFARAESTFRLCSREQLDAAAAKVRDMRARGTLQQWFEKRESVRLEVGQSFNVYAVKPASSAE